MSEQMPLVGPRRLQERLSSFAIGLGVVGVLTAAFALYLPLHRAHAALVPAFSDLSEKAAALRDEVQDTEKALAAAKAERDGLRKKDEEKAGAQAEIRRKLQQKKAALLASLGKYIDRGHITVELTREHLVLGFKASLVQTPHAVDVSRAGATILCQIAKTLASGETVEVHAYSAEKSASPLLAAKYPTSWALSAAHAASVAATLKEGCGVDGAVLQAIAHGHFGAGALPSVQADLLRLVVGVPSEQTPSAAPPERATSEAAP